MIIQDVKKYSGKYCKIFYQIFNKVNNGIHFKRISKGSIRQGD